MADYEIYHKSYTNAIDEIIDYLRDKNLYMDENDVWNEISTGKPRPKEGGTNRFNILLYNNDGTPAKKVVAFQIADLGKSYELNMYLSSAKLRDYTQDQVTIREDISPRGYMPYDVQFINNIDKEIKHLGFKTHQSTLNQRQMEFSASLVNNPHEVTYATELYIMDSAGENPVYITLCNSGRDQFCFHGR